MAKEILRVADHRKGLFTILAIRVVPTILFVTLNDAN